MRTLVSITILLFIACRLGYGVEREQQALVLLQQAGGSYLAGNYTKSKESYIELQQLVVTPSWSVNYNLGNTYFRLNQLGESLFHFRLAHILAPRRPEVSYNLKYVRQQVGQESEGQSLGVFLLPLSERELLLLLALLSLFTAFFVIVLNYSKNEWAKWGRNLSLIFLLYPVSYGTKLYFFTPDFGVVTAKEASVYSGSGVDNVMLFKLAVGSEFEVVRSAQSVGADWMMIKMFDGKKGWIHRQQVVVSTQ